MSSSSSVEATKKINLDQEIRDTSKFEFSFTSVRVKLLHILKNCLYTFCLLHMKTIIITKLSIRHQLKIILLAYLI